jgi:hypothetical protein
VNAIRLKAFLLVAQLRQEDVKDGYDAHLLQPYIFFHIQLLCTHMFRVHVLMFVREGELKSHAHACVFVYV